MWSARRTGVSVGTLSEASRGSHRPWGARTFQAL